MVEERGPGRPPAGTMPLSASRMPIMISPEAQQVMNELMRTEGITDRSAIVDKVIKEYGDKIKGIRPAMIKHGKIIQTQEGDQVISDMPGIAAAGDAATTGLEEILKLKMQRLRNKEVEKSLKMMDEGSEGGGLEGIIKLAYLQRMDGQQAPDDNPMKEIMNFMMPLYGMRMLERQTGGGGDSDVTKAIGELRNELKEIVRRQNDGQPNSQVLELQKRMENMEAEKRYHELIKTVVDKSGTHKEALDTIKEMQKLRTDSEIKSQEKLETARQQFQEQQEKNRQEQQK
jgi:hypothetical protein